jgi:hypothetical protein
MDYEGPFGLATFLSENTTRRITFFLNLHPTSTQDAKKPEGLPEKVSSVCREG